MRRKDLGNRPFDPVITTLGAGFASVADRETGKDLGTVSLIDFPVRRGGNRIVVEKVWEARKPGELAVAQDGFPSFDTRKEAAQWLAEH